MAVADSHTLPNERPERWQPLPEHLENVAVEAGRAAEVFGARDWGYVVGLLHDIGKINPDFQDYLRQSCQVAGLLSKKIKKAISPAAIPSEHMAHMESQGRSICIPENVPHGLREALEERDWLAVVFFFGWFFLFGGFGLSGYRALHESGGFCSAAFQPTSGRVVAPF